MPSIDLRVRQNIRKTWNFSFEYANHLDGAIKSNTLTLNNPKLLWNYMALGGEYIFNHQFSLMKYKIIPEFLFGLQKHEMPFLKQESGAIYTMAPITFESIYFGYYLSIKKINPLRYYVYNRFQVPLSQQKDLKIKNGFSFDGEFGAEYMIRSDWSLNLSWGGQYHFLTYAASNVEGTYTLAHSKVSGIIGYHW